MKSFAIALAAVVALSTSAFAVEPYARNDGALKATNDAIAAAKAAGHDSVSHGQSEGGSGRSAQ